MSFEKAKTLVSGFLGASLILWVLILLGNALGGAVGALVDIMSIVAIGCLIVAVFLMVTCLKCPYCGKRIIRNVLKVKSCPHCRRDLKTGLKGKKKKR